MINNFLVNIVNKSLNERGKPTSRGNYSYHCPKCEHHKKKLEVNCEELSSHFGSFQCWVCGYKGKNILKLIKGSSFDDITEVKKILKIKHYNQNEKTEEIISLPKEFKSFLENGDFTTRQALYYLKSRGISKSDIEKYNIGYCESGVYSNMIIIPSYNEKGILNYFMTRSFEKNPYRKTKNPPISRDIIPFELFINWDFDNVLCVKK